MAPSRNAILDAASVLVRMQAAVDCDYNASYDDDSDGPTEARLRKAAEKAQANLDGFLRSKAARLALDALLPGWRYIDASDHLPRELWHSFVSNDRDEWLAWLTEHGVPAEVARRLVDAVFNG